MQTYKGNSQTNVASYVFFDLESTGLPHLERNKTTITELCFIAVAREDFERATIQKLPALSKIVINYNPRRTISRTASEMTGLTNDLLKNSPVFNQRTNTLLTFLDELPRPICLIAHNGNRFDFKLLIKEFSDANIDLPNDILCIDSLNAFRKLLTKNDLKCSEDTADNGNSSDNKDDWPDLNVTPEDWDSIDKLCFSFEHINSSTPKIQKTDQKKLVIEKSDTNYKLDSLYRRLLKKNPPCSHRAENDCYALIECALALSKHFVTFVDDHAVKLNEIKPFKQY